MFVGSAAAVVSFGAHRCSLWPVFYLRYIVVRVAALLCAHRCCLQLLQFIYRASHLRGVCCVCCSYTCCLFMADTVTSLAGPGTWPVVALCPLHSRRRCCWCLCGPQQLSVGCHNLTRQQRPCALHCEVGSVLCKAKGGTRG